MLKFIKAVSAVVVGNLVSWIILGALALAGLLAAIATLGGAEGRASHHAIANKTALVLDLDMNIRDTPEQHAPGEAISRALGGESERTVGLLDLVNTLDAATKDPRIESILIRGSLRPGGYGSGLPAIAEVRRALTRFRAAGKQVVAQLESPQMRDYYLATAANRVMLHPFSELGVQGLAVNSVYFGAAFKKYGVGVQTTKVGTYKSAVEPFTADRMSPADRTQTAALLDSIWTGLTDDIAASRGIPADKIRTLANERGILTPAEAVEARLADGSAYLDEIIDDRIEHGAEDEDTGSFAQIHILDYMRRIPKPHTADDDTPKIAVVYAEGEIVDGDGFDGEVFGGRWLAAEIRRLNRDESVKALVLRVNSPGGSAFASEVARREIANFRESGRPVIVSMGALAASGGYWISAGANRIFAEKTTITGSIGVFGLMFNVRDLASAFGVNFDGVKTSRYADIETFSRPKTEDELALLQKFTDDIYGSFVGIVSEGRKLPVARVEEIAQGRVWSGSDALKIGLVDEIGGITAAIAHARSEAKLGNDAPVVQIPEKTDSAQALAHLFAGDERRDPVARANAPTARLIRLTEARLRRLASFNDSRHVYARIPYMLELE